MSLNSDLLEGLEIHKFMFVDERSNLDPVAVAADIREGISELPETCATFKLSRVTDTNPSNLDRRIIWLCGSWRVPKRFRENNPAKYVNPNYPHRARYADIGIDCTCGQSMVFAKAEHSHQGDCQHTGDCSWDARKAAWDRLLDVRRQWFKTAVSLWLSATDIGVRMGFDNKETTYKAAQRADVKIRELNQRARGFIAETWRRLFREGYTNPEIADAYGTTAGTVRAYRAKQELPSSVRVSA